MVYLIVNYGLGGIPFDNLFVYSDTVCLPDPMATNFTSNSLTRKYSFFQRIINDWNSLPRDIIEIM